MDANLCVQRTGRWGIKCESTKLYREGRVEVSKSHASSGAPVGAVAKEEECRTIAVATLAC